MANQAKTTRHERHSDFIDPGAIRATLAEADASPGSVRATLEKASRLGGLSVAEAAVLLKADDEALDALILEAAGDAKRRIYGRRMVLFAPLYIGNRCSNDCLYCSFRSANRDLERRSLSLDEVEAETRALLREGHKRLLVLSGEDATEPLERTLAAIERIYATRERAPGSGAETSIRRINVEIAPLSVEDFSRLKSARIGTYACFQETYDPELYAAYHRRGPKADYLNRLTVMDRAMEAGIDDVGIGALFGLGDWRFEALGLLEHAAHLEACFGCGPHTVSVPRIEPAPGAPAATSVPKPLDDREFRRLVAVLRLALPYTGIILSTRESETLRDELFRYGVSQISAGSRTNPGAYADASRGSRTNPGAYADASRGSRTNPGAYADAGGGSGADSGAQFQLGDHRSLSEVVSRLAALGYVPSFCTGCYRKGRVGADFMDLAKPGLIQRFCEPNALFTYAEYLKDFADEGTRAEGFAYAARMVESLPDAETKLKALAGLAEVAGGKRDVYL